MVICETYGDYSQKIRIGSTNEVEVHKGGTEIFKGEAVNIVDRHDKLSFNDKNGKSYVFVKCIRTTCS